MKRLSRGLFACVSVFFYSQSGMADTGTVTVVKPTIFMGSSYAGVLVQISPAIPGLDGCANSAGQYVFINFATVTAPTGRDLYATVLAAFMANRTVTFGTAGCSSDGSYPLVNSVGINQ